MPACLLYVSSWSEALKGWIHTVYWKCLHRSQVTASTATEQQPEQSSHNRKPVLNRPAPLMVIHSAGKHTEKLFRLCYNPVTGSRRWCKIGRGRKTVNKGSLKGGNTGGKREEPEKWLLIWHKSSSCFHPGQGLIMFTPSKNQVAVLKPLTMHNTALIIMSMPGLRPSTVCLWEGSVWGEHCHLLCRTQALPTDGPENTNTHSLSYSYSSSHHSVWWYHTAAEKPIEIKEIINKKSCIVKAYAAELQLSDCESDRGLFN